MLKKEDSAVTVTVAWLVIQADDGVKTKERKEKAGDGVSR